MANVWKIGSRWSDHGSKESSIISVFRRNNVVFVGTETNNFINKTKIGDYIAIADGFLVCSVAKVISEPKCLSEFSIKTNNVEESVFDYEKCKNWSYGVRVKIVDLDQNDRIQYKERGTFCAANQIWNRVIELYDNHEKKFSIKSYTSTLFKASSSSYEYRPLFDCTRYVIPVFQRPYSWDEKQLEPFIDDIFKGYWGAEKDISLQEPIFIGTMQLSEKKLITKTESEQEVIDGQQRISTITTFVKILQLKYPDSLELQKIKINWLETRVNSGTQNECLTEFLDMKSIESLLDIKETQNKYVLNAKLILDYYEENLKCEDANTANFAIDDFVGYLSSKIYFVVIETYAGISKTIQIFNTINTTGLDLNGGDLFKIRMYEYLRDQKHQDETVFEQISELYKYIDDKNVEYGDSVTNIIEILGIYKDYLISKYDMPEILFDYGTETFFERLFDKLLGVNDWEHFSKVVNIDVKFELSLEDIRKFIEVKYIWHKSKYISAENMFALRLLWWSRYSRYWRIVYQVIFKYGNDPQKISETLIIINKIAFVYSIRFAKSVYRTHSFMQNAIKKLYALDYEQFIYSLREKLLSHCDKDHTLNELSGYITDNAKKKNLICCMSAYCDEIKQLNCDEIKQPNCIEDIKRLLFETRFDIEHIHATADETIPVDNTLQNSIGNLSMLEEGINRSISDGTFDHKKGRYIESKYYSIRTLVEYERWTEDEIRSRGKQKVDEIMNYIFNTNK